MTNVHTIVSALRWQLLSSEWYSEVPISRIDCIHPFPVVVCHVYVTTPKLNGPIRWLGFLLMYTQVNRGHMCFQIHIDWTNQVIMTINQVTRNRTHTTNVHIDQYPEWKETRKGVPWGPPAILFDMPIAMHW